MVEHRRTTTSIYEDLHDDLLGAFYYEILNNIKEGILSEAMYHEIDLIKVAANKKEISLSELYEKGALFRQNEIDLSRK